MVDTSTKQQITSAPNWGGEAVTVTVIGGVPFTTVTKAYKHVDCWQKTISTSTGYMALKRAIKRTNNKGLKRLWKLKPDMGSEFYTSEAWITRGILSENSGVFGEKRTYVWKPSSSTTQTWRGVCLPYAISDELRGIPPLSGAERTELMAHGTTLIARALPTNPTASLANFLGELRRDGLPKLPGASTADSSKNWLQKWGEERLNSEFALKPMISDLRSFAQVVKDYDKILKQYERNVGKGVRRSRRLPDEVKVEQLPDISPYYPQGGSLPASYFNPGVLHREVTTVTKRWFSGMFTYYFNASGENSSLRDKIQYRAQQADLLLGTDLSPELLWNLAPWSWAFDWYTNAGDVLHNISAFLSDGLVMKYGYVMEHKLITTTYTLDGYSLKSNVQGSIAPLKMTTTQERKVRLKASPFGFGLTDTDLSPRQKAIIAALGITQNARVAK